MRSLREVPGWGLIASSVILFASTALATTLIFDSTLAGWTPFVSAYGRGDAKNAAHALKLTSRVYDTVLHHTEIDEPTQEFIDKALRQFEDFDLDDLHDILPETQNGFRLLTVRGEVEGGRYLLRRADPNSSYAVTIYGPRNNIGDLSLLFRAKESRTRDDKQSFLVGTRVGLGIGPLSYDALTVAVADALRLSSTGDPRSGSASLPLASPATRTRVKQANPGLGEEDVTVLGTLYEAFPSMSETLGRMLRVVDVRAFPVPGSSYQHVTVRLQFVPGRLDDDYPELSRHLERMDELVHVNARWTDGWGRTLMGIRVDTKTREFGLECYVKDGRVLPFTKDHVFDNEPIDPMSGALDNSRMVVDARIELLGIILKLSEFRVDVRYRPHETYAAIDSRIVGIPKIRVEGAALGIVPTNMVDAFIPGTMASLTRDFFRVLAYGNGGKGAVAHLDIGSSSKTGAGVTILTFDLETIDNYLIKVAVGIFNDRVMPNDDAIDEMKRVAGALHRSFVRDLEAFERKVGG